VRLVGHERQAPLGLERVLDDVVAVDPDPPRGGPQNTGQRSQRCRLAGAVGTDQADDFARGDRERQVRDRSEEVPVAAA
jgi:hypothetical protein